VRGRHVQCQCKQQDRHQKSHYNLRGVGQVNGVIFSEVLKV
jgi:hypothetical protein